MILLKNCPICDAEQWKDLDYMRDFKLWFEADYREKDEKVGFKICQECGFVTYDYIEDERLAQMYDRQRPVMNAQNIITCNRKNEYHKKFIKDVLNEIEQREGPRNIIDIGCAQGALLKLIKETINIRNENLFGTEYSQAFRSWGNNEYILNITQEPDTSIKYDLIIYYHVLEHIQHPDTELDKAIDMLNDDGYLYISVPSYLDKLEESSGSNCDNFENYYHLNHVNVFSKQAIENLFNKKGLKIVKHDTTMYGLTYLLQKGPIQDIIKENYEDIEQKLKNQKQAIELYKQHKFQEAIDVDPTYTDAYIFLTLSKENMKELKKQIDILEKGLDVNPNNIKLMSQIARTYFQFDENTPEKQFYSNNIKRAEDLFKKIAELKPGMEDTYYFLALINYKYKKDYDSAIRYINRQMEINPVKFQEANNLKAVIYKEKEKINI